MTTGTDIDSDLVRKLAALLDETGLTEIEIANGDWRVRVARQPNGVVETLAPQAAPPSGPVEPVPVEEEPAAHAGTVASPMVGTVFLAPEPGAAPFVQAGQRVSAGATLLIIEAMKTFNEVRAPHDGTVVRVLVADGTPVEYGEPLLILD